jgi:CYTH domain-containing protein
VSVAGSGLEIERVWVLRHAPVPPSDRPSEVWEIEQGYLPLDLDDAAFREGRIRRVRMPDGQIRCFHTVKRGGGMVREESERAIDPSEFERLWPVTVGRRIEKVRRRIVEAGLTWEIDEFRHLPLVMAEVELADANAACPLPAWLAPLVVREVTEDARYRNAALAMRGLPAPP